MRWPMMILAKGDKERRRFTLVEVMIVVIIVGILAGVAVPLYTSYVKKARRTEAMAAISAIRAAEIVYWADPIGGEVTAKGPYSYDEFKIVAYVKTDVWYAHPWEGAFASINEDGFWELESVERTPSPTEIGLFLVEKDYIAPPIVENPKDIGAIKSITLTMEHAPLTTDDKGM